MQKAAEFGRLAIYFARVLVSFPFSFFVPRVSLHGGEAIIT
jgi:hypothetical protein